MRLNKYKNAILFVMELMSKLWRVFPKNFRTNFIFFFIVLDSRGKNTANSLSSLFNLKDKLNLVINERAMAFGNGIHPKHRLTDYHDFFVENIEDKETVIDVGCGYGAVARTIAKNCPKSQILGIDINKESIDTAKSENTYNNLSFRCCDAIKMRMSTDWDVVILSNILEHIDDRIEFIIQLRSSIKPKKFLIRVPLFERNWEMALKKELGVNYYSDDDHKIEHSIKEFYEEMTTSGLKIKEMKTKWGEIWAICQPLRAND